MISRTPAFQRLLAFVRAAVLCAALVPMALAGSSAIARAQSPAPAGLPTAPGAAEKASQGGYTGAKASLPGDNGSPLEPYLFLFILAGGGVIAWVFAVGTDIRVRRESYNRAQRR